MQDRLVRVEMKPALAAGFLGSGVPGDAECLVTPTRELDQVLLQRADAKGVGDLVVA